MNEQTRKCLIMNMLLPSSLISLIMSNAPLSKSMGHEGGCGVPPDMARTKEISGFPATR